MASFWKTLLLEHKGMYLPESPRADAYHLLSSKCKCSQLEEFLPPSPPFFPPLLGWKTNGQNIGVSFLKPKRRWVLEVTI